MTTHSKTRNPIVTAVLLSTALAFLVATPALAGRTVDASEPVVVSDDVYNTLLSVTSAVSGASSGSGANSNNRSGLGDDTNPGAGSGTGNSPNTGTNNPNKKPAGAGPSH